MILPINQQGLYQDGNSIFDDVHILGTLHCDTQIGAGIITATSFYGDGSNLTGIDVDVTSVKNSAGSIVILGTTTGATHSGKALFNEIELSGKLYDGDGDFGTSGQVLSSDGTDTNWVNTGSLTAGAASQVGVTAVTDNFNHFITFVDNSSGNRAIKVDTSLIFNPSTNTLGQINIAALVVTGNLTVSGELKDGDGNFGSSGQVLSSDGTDTAWVNSGSLTAGAASQVGVTAVNDNSTHFLTFVDTSSGNENIKVDTGLTYNPSTNVLTATTFSGTATQAANLNNHDTGDLSEGTNQYFTNARARGSISVSGDLSYDNSTGVITYNDSASGVPSAITVADESSDTTCFPLFATDTTGNLAPKTGSNLTFNSNTGALGATSFVKSGGTSSQFLKADGSVDSAAYSTASIPSGSVMLFYHTSAPTGWTKITTHNNKALRVVSGSGGGSGGNNTFTTVFSNQSLSVSGTANGNTNSVNSGSVSISGNCSGTQYIYTNTTQNTLNIAQLAAHNHPYDRPRGTFGGLYGFVDSMNSGSSGINSTSNTGSGSAHGHAVINYPINGSNFTFSGSGSPSNHSHTFNDTVNSTGSLDMRVQYIDVIICSKD